MVVTLSYESFQNKRKKLVSLVSCPRLLGVLRMCFMPHNMESLFKCEISRNASEFLWSLCFSAFPLLLHVGDSKYLCSS